jgi:hypothetical protein
MMLRAQYQNECLQRQPRDQQRRFDHVLTDPMVRLMMAADQVDPAELEALLRSLTRARESFAQPGSAKGRSHQW